MSRTYDGMMMAIPAPHWALFRRTSRSHSHKLLNLFDILSIGYTGLKNNQNRINRFQRGAECAFRQLSDKAFADALHEVASSVQLARYQKHPRGPKKKPPERTAYQHGKHVSTAKLLAQR
jgi:hypothetical protein